MKRFVSAALLLLSCCAHTITIPANRHGLPVVSNVETYNDLVKKNPGKQMINLQACFSSIRLEIRYAGPDNFMKRTLYPAARAYARKPVAIELGAIQKELEPQGLGLKIFDAYRPYAVTEEMWNEIGNPEFVADPAKGSRHNRGCAVDLTLVSLASGQELEMPSGYDEFTPRAHHNYQDASAKAIRNRALLRMTMEKHGFAAYEPEWWHYDFRGYEGYELMDLSFADLDAVSRSCP